MAYKKLIKVSNVCQLLDKRKYLASQTINGVTFTNNGDGTITVNGTATDRAGYRLYSARYLPSASVGHKCLIESNVSLPGGDNIILHSDDWAYSSDKPIGTITESNIYISVFPGNTANNLVFKPQFFDLTEMYSAGHEPTTVEQFRQDFPEEMYDYSPYCWLTSYKRVFMTGGGNYLTSYQRNLTCKTKNLFDIPLTRGYPSNTNFDNSTKRTFTIGTYIVGLTRNNHYSEGYIKNVNVSKNRISFKLNNGWYGVSIPCLLTVGKTYTFSCKTDKNYSTNIGISYYKENGELISYTDNSGNKHKIVKSFTVPENTYYTLILFTGAYGGEYTYYDIQLELGDTATNYVPYGHL